MFLLALLPVEATVVVVVVTRLDWMLLDPTRVFPEVEADEPVKRSNRPLLPPPAPPPEAMEFFPSTMTVKADAYRAVSRSLLKDIMVSVCLYSSYTACL